MNTSAKGTIYLFSTRNFSTVDKCFLNTGRYSNSEVSFSKVAKMKTSVFRFVLTDCNNMRYDFNTTIADFLQSLHTVDTCINEVSYITIKSIYGM